MVITCAEYLAQDIRNRFENAGAEYKVIAVPNAVDLEKYRPGDKRAAKSALGASPELPMILMMANLAPHKGQETAIRATAMLRNRGFSVVCWLAGEDRQEGNIYRRKLEELAREQNVGDYVNFLGYRNDGHELMQAADVVLLPSTQEGLPICLLESQAVGTPVIGAPHPGILEIVEDGMNGFVIPQDDICGYADRIQMLLEKKEIRRQISASGREHVVRKHSWRTYEDRILEAYKQLNAI